MAKNNSTIDHTNVEATESFIVETLLNKGKVIIPDFGHLELKSLGDRRTVFFKSSEDKSDSFLHIMPADADREKKDVNKIYTLVTVPLKEGQSVNLPKIGIFRPDKRSDGKIHISFIPSSYLRKLLNKDKEDEVDMERETRTVIEEMEEVNIINKLSSNVKIFEAKEDEITENSFSNSGYFRELENPDPVNEDYAEFKPKSTASFQREPARVGDVLVPQDDTPEKPRRNLGGVFLLIVAALAITFLVISNVYYWKNKDSEEPIEYALPVGESIDLPSLAEQHYGHSAFWIYIFDANSDKLESPLNIPKNTSLVIPDLKTAYDVDVTDSLEIQRANILADIILSQLKNK